MTIAGLVLISVFLALFASADCHANGIEEKFIEAGLVDIHSIDESIKVDLVNSDPVKNYFRENFYNGLNKAYLRNEAARKLSSAQNDLKAQFPEYSILIMDAARPRSVSKLMFNELKGTRFEKFVADPDKGSMHNYGIAVDVTIVDANGKKIDMGFTPFYKGRPSIYLGYIKTRLFGLSDAQKQNRALLANVMQKAGFFPLSYEWWHFNAIPEDDARKKYPSIE